MTKERQIEEELIRNLSDLGYTYRSDIRDKKTLEENFRKKFEALNKVKLSDKEFERLKTQIITGDVFEASQTLRSKNSLEREDGTALNYMLVNINEWCKNDFEVINQLRINTEYSLQRYDVILLINGIPVVQIELKSLQVSPNRAMQQIVKYKNDPGNGYTNSLLCFMQLFIVSNKTNTFYFANNNNKHFRFDAEEQFLPVYKLADKDNKKITHLDDFTPAFLSKCTLAEMIGRYMVLVESEREILMMRPYQIYAVKAIIDCIRENRGNGYIWHTTGSGKTLTSFKASTLLKDNPDIEKCLFVVDRKDLDRQTRQEFNKFQENCVEENTNTETLVERMLSKDYADKVIVTTIQKLGLALDEKHKKNYKKRLEPLKNKRMVFIFDECHRSQFGENHKAIKEFFPNAQLFGFTGTPIFEQNATYKTIEGTTATMLTTQDVFQKELHSYTITNAIEDKYVLRFHIDYYKPEKEIEIDSEQHKIAVINAILNKHDKATNHRRFNAFLATNSIKDAIRYYRLFKKIQQEKSNNDPDYIPLNIACIFSPPAEGNRDILQIQEDLPQEKADNKQEPHKKKQALIEIIEDYNKQYGTNHSVNNFDLYYQDIQKRIKDQKYPNKDYPRKNKIDITIVVDMLLTGFDSKYLNTLYVDKKLKYHRLIQAFSRTNRVLNDTKPYGNILDFRQQENAVDQAIALFSGVETDNPKEIWLVEPAPKVIRKYESAVKELKTFMQTQGLMCEPQEVYNLKGDQARAKFINTFKEIQRYKTQLDQYTDLKEQEKEYIKKLLPEDNLRSFKAAYLDTAKELKVKQNKPDKDTPPIVRQLDSELILFASAIIDYDYIMKLISQYTNTTPKKQKITREKLIELLKANANLMDEQEDIIAYINSLKTGVALSEKAIREGFQKFKIQKRKQVIQNIAEKHHIPKEKLQNFVDKVIECRVFDAENLPDLLAHVKNWKKRAEQEEALMKDLKPLLEKLANGRPIAGLEAYE